MHGLPQASSKRIILLPPHCPRLELHPSITQCQCPAQVTCGTVIKLQHIGTNHHLHSHEVAYGSGSGQQSVTATSAGDDAGSYWVVKGPEVPFLELLTALRGPTTDPRNMAR